MTEKWSRLYQMCSKFNFGPICILAQIGTNTTVNLGIFTNEMDLDPARNKV